MARFGSIGTQYFDNAGDPLISGKLSFFESGTSTDKDTFADVDLTITNTNPVILTAAGRQPNIFFSGTARVILTESDGTQIEVRDPIGGETGQDVIPAWNSVVIYGIPDLVRGSDGNFYISITNGNQDNDPVTSPVNWTQVRFIRVWNVNENYSQFQITEGSDGLLYSSVINNNIANDPTTDFVNWKPAVDAISPPVIRSASKIFALRNF